MNEMYTKLFSGARITQMGLGLLGRGKGDALFLARAGAQLTVTDLKSTEVLASSVEPLQEYANVTFRLGEHAFEDFEEKDLVLKSAGVPLDSVHIAHARRHGVPVDMSASLFARIVDVPMVGVTGTRGKSTVTCLIEALLRADGKEVLLGGNIRGVSNLTLLEQVTKKSVGVFELDSWQCQGFGEECSLQVEGVRQGPHSPSVAVFTSFMVDHMNYYGGAMETYLADKAHIFLHQHEGDLLVIGSQALDALKPYRARIRARVVVADASHIPKAWTVRLLGPHGRYNVGIAVAVARELGVDDAVIRQVVETFGPLPGRLQYIGEHSGVRVYNDTNATTPDAVSASLRALDPENSRSVVLIAGGVDKGLEPSVMVRAIVETCARVILLPGSGTEALLRLDMLPKDRYTCVESLTEAVDEAFRVAGIGQTIVLSPGFSSHNLFKNEYDRGDQFNALVQSK
jgi:UDP-N-acetylmuramoylalanine--D-glutamate ligase